MKKGYFSFHRRYYIIQYHTQPNIRMQKNIEKNVKNKKTYIVWKYNPIICIAGWETNRMYIYEKPTPNGNEKFSSYQNRNRVDFFSPKLYTYLYYYTRTFFYATILYGSFFVSFDILLLSDFAIFYMKKKLWKRGTTNIHSFFFIKIACVFFSLVSGKPPPGINHSRKIVSTKMQYKMMKQKTNRLLN